MTTHDALAIGIVALVMYVIGPAISRLSRAIVGRAKPRSVLSREGAALAIIRSVAGDATAKRVSELVWTAAPPSHDITITVRLSIDGPPMVRIERYGMTSDWHDPETARAIFVALCHLGCA